MKILSVAVPSYNVEQYLDKCLTSFSDERLKAGLEVLIVNDGSKDRTEEIALSYVAKFPEIFKLINKENGGHGSAVNSGMQNATGVYFRIIDGDDWVNTDSLALEIKLMETINSDIIVDQRRDVHMVTGEETYRPLPEGTVFDQDLGVIDAYKNETADYFSLHTMSVRLSVLKEHNITLPEKAFYVDYVFILEAFAYSKTVTFLDLDVYRYLIGNANQSVSMQNFVKRYDQHERVVKECLRFAGQYKENEEMLSFVKHRTVLVINTHYNISLLFNDNRKEGRKMAKEFSFFLKENYPEFYRATRRRYRTAKILNIFGINYDKLQKTRGKD